MEEEGLLRHRADRTPPGRCDLRRQFPPVDQDASRLRRQQAGQQVEDGALACPGCARQHGEGARGQREIDAPQHFRMIAAVAETDILQADLPLEGDGRRIRGRRGIRRGLARLDGSSDGPVGRRCVDELLAEFLHALQHRQQPLEDEDQDQQVGERQLRPHGCQPQEACQRHGDDAVEEQAGVGLQARGREIGALGPARGGLESRDMLRLGAIGLGELEGLQELGDLAAHPQIGL